MPTIALPAAACALLAFGVAVASHGDAGVAGGSPSPGRPVDRSAATPPTGPTGGYECRWTEAPIAIDGTADEPAWRQAPVADGFGLPWLGKQARRAKAGTRARLLWDRSYLYFAADMHDADLRAGVTERDGPVWRDDALGLLLRPAADKPGAYLLAVNPANTVLDLFLPTRDADGYRKFKADGDFDLKTAVRRRPGPIQPGGPAAGWCVEGRVAWKSLLRTGGRPEPGETWAFALCRVDRSAGDGPPEWSTTAALTAVPNFESPPVDGLSPIRFTLGENAPAAADAAAKLPDALPPLKTSRVAGSPEPPHPYRPARAYPRLTLPRPVAIARQPNSDRMLAVVHDDDWNPTQIVRFVDDPAVDRYETLLKLDGITYDFAFHPDYARNGYVYVGMNAPALGKSVKQTRVVRYHIDPAPPYAMDPKSATPIIEWDSDGHNGGALDFGPDGMLYVTSGDGTSDSDRWLSGQDLSRPLAKVLRIDVDHPDGRAYSVPKDNPFVGEPGARPETWCYGLRNPWRMKFDPANGQLWVTQNGQDQYEQVYLIERGANYGWSASEGSHPFYPERHRGSPIRPPTAEHPHAEARSLTGGFVYHSQAIPDLRGAYVYGDYATGKIWGIRHDGKSVTWHREIADTEFKITGFGTNAAGDLLVLDHVKEGGIYRLEPLPAELSAKAVAVAEAFPRTLSASGLFKSVKDHAMADGVLPYSVNAELWSDGAHKERFIAVPAEAANAEAGDAEAGGGSAGDAGGADRRIGFTPKGGFDFPDRAVLVKSFALPTADAAGRPGGRRWVETRFMTRQQGEWVGYSYAWNADGTDATLVEAGGRDQPFQVRDPAAPGGVREQTWHFPSRAECMVCHSRAANYVLGVSLPQFNRDHDYGGGRADNQLHVLERVGLLKADWRGHAEAAVRADGEAKHLSGDALEAYVRQQKASDGQRQAPSSSCLLPKEPGAYDRLVDPYDPAADLTARARSYLHANCAICHIEAGGGNSAMELEFSTPTDKMRVVGVPPLHDPAGVRDGSLIAPGDPARSILAHRMSVRGPGQMPPLATSVVDRRAVELLTRWIREMKPAERSAAGAAGAAAGPR